MSDKKYNVDNRAECWKKGYEESEKFRQPDLIFSSPEVFHLMGELYFRIEELENKVKGLEIYSPKTASRQRR